MSGSDEMNNLDRTAQRSGSARKDSKRNLQEMLKRRYQQSRGSPSSNEHPSPIQEPVSFRPPAKQEVKKINTTPPGGASGGAEGGGVRQTRDANGNFVYDNNFDSLPHDDAAPPKTKGQSQGGMPKSRDERQRKPKSTGQGQFDDALSTVIGEISSESNKGAKGARSKQRVASGESLTFENNFDDMDQPEDCGGNYQPMGRQDSHARQQLPRERNIGTRQASRSAGSQPSQQRGRNGPQASFMGRDPDQMAREREERLQKLRRPRQLPDDHDDPMARLIRMAENKDSDGDERMEGAPKHRSQGSTDHDENQVHLGSLIGAGERNKREDARAGNEFNELVQSMMGGNKGKDGKDPMAEMFGPAGEGGVDNAVDPLAQLMGALDGIGGKEGDNEGGGADPLAQLMGGLAGGVGQDGQQDPIAKILGELAGQADQGEAGEGQAGGQPDPMAQIMALMGGGGQGQEGWGVDPLAKVMEMMGAGGGQGGGRGGGPDIPMPMSMMDEGEKGGGGGGGKGGANPPMQISILDEEGGGRGRGGGANIPMPMSISDEGERGGGCRRAGAQVPMPMSMLDEGEKGGGGRGGGGGGIGGGRGGGEADDPMAQIMKLMGRGGGRGGRGGGRGGGGGGHGEGDQRGGQMNQMSQMMAMMGRGGGRGGGGRGGGQSGRDQVDPMSQVMSMMAGRGGRRGGGQGGQAGGRGRANPMSQMVEIMGEGQGQAGGQGQARGQGQAGNQFIDEEIDVENASLNDQIQQLLGYESLKAHNNKSPKSDGMCTIIVIDTSGSMQGDPITEAGQFIAQFLNGLEEVQFEYAIEENVAVVCAGREVHVLQHLTTDYSAVRRSVDTVYADGPSPLHLALILPISILVLDPQQGRDYIARCNDHRVSPRVILITDGYPTSSEDIPGESGVRNEQESLAIQTLCGELLQTVQERTLSEVYCVPVGNANMDFLQHLSGSLGGHVMQTTDAKHMSRNYLHHHVVGNLRSSGHDTTNRATVSAVVQQVMACSDEADVEAVMKILSQGEPDVEGRNRKLVEQAAGQGAGGGGNMAAMMQSMMGGMGGGGLGGGGNMAAMMQNMMGGGGPDAGGNMAAMMQNLMGGMGAGGQGAGGNMAAMMQNMMGGMGGGGQGAGGNMAAMMQNMMGGMGAGGPGAGGPGAGGNMAAMMQNMMGGMGAGGQGGMGGGMGQQEMLQGLMGRGGGEVSIERGGVSIERGGPAGGRGGVSIERGGVNIERGGVSIERGGPAGGRGGVSIERGGVNIERGGVSIERGGPAGGRGGPAGGGQPMIGGGNMEAMMQSMMGGLGGGGQAGGENMAAMMQSMMEGLGGRGQQAGEDGQLKLDDGPEKGRGQQGGGAQLGQRGGDLVIDIGGRGNERKKENKEKGRIQLNTRRRPPMKMGTGLRGGGLVVDYEAMARGVEGDEIVEGAVGHNDNEAVHRSYCKTDEDLLNLLPGAGGDLGLRSGGNPAMTSGMINTLMDKNNTKTTSQYWDELTGRLPPSTGQDETGARFGLVMSAEKMGPDDAPNEESNEGHSDNDDMSDDSMGQNNPDAADVDIAYHPDRNQRFGDRANQGRNRNEVQKGAANRVGQGAIRHGAASTRSSIGDYYEDISGQTGKPGSRPPKHNLPPQKDIKSKPASHNEQAMDRRYRQVDPTREPQRPSKSNRDTGSKQTKSSTQQGGNTGYEGFGHVNDDDDDDDDAGEQGAVGYDRRSANRDYSKHEVNDTKGGGVDARYSQPLPSASRPPRSSQNRRSDLNELLRQRQQRRTPQSQRQTPAYKAEDSDPDND